MSPCKRLIDALGAARTVYFFGLAKNTGKTVALRQAMGEARDKGLKIGVTSVGRDGEAFDAIYRDFEKPTLTFLPGDLVVTSEGLLPERATATALVHPLRIASPLGDLVVARVLEVCDIEIAGPSTISQLRAVRAAMYQLGVDLFLVDGALDRRAAALPDVCDGVVMSTGAALAEDEAGVVARTRSALEMVAQPAQAPAPLAYSYSPVYDAPEAVRQECAGTPAGMLDIRIRGAVTTRFLDYLIAEDLLRRCRLFVDCFTKVFIAREHWERYVRAGLQLHYLDPVRVLAVTVNPTSPMSDGLDPAGLLSAVRRVAGAVPVFDVLSPAYGSAQSARQAACSA